MMPGGGCIYQLFSVLSGTVSIGDLKPPPKVSRRSKSNVAGAIRVVGHTARTERH
jgi:hypothetical protein